MEVSYNKFKLSEEILRKALKQCQDRGDYGLDRIVFVGDSLIEQYHLDKAFPGRHLVNRGIGGDTTFTLLQTIDFRVVDLSPRKVFIMVGTNDIGRRMNNSTPISYLTLVFSYLKYSLPNSKIYFCLIPPTNHDYADSRINVLAASARSNSKIRKLNQMISSLAKSKGIEVIDTHTPLLCGGDQLPIDMTVDGVHLTESAYAILTRVFEKYLD